MVTVGVFEAKTHLSSLLDRVERGETITITRHGEPVAVLAPAKETGAKPTHGEIVAAFRKIRGSVRGKVDVRKLIQEGRRY